VKGILVPASTLITTSSWQADRVYFLLGREKKAIVFEMK